MKILFENALESWASAIKYSEEILIGKATFSNKKNFVSSLQNAIELFVKQYMLDTNDYRIAIFNNIGADGEPTKSFLLSEDLNRYFLNIPNDKKYGYKTLGFAEIINIIQSTFKDFLDENYSNEGITVKLNTLKRLRNNETHFYISNEDFLTDSEFKDLYKLMYIFFELLKHYNLLTSFFGEPFDEYKIFSFNYTELDESFSYRSKLINNDFVKNLKKNTEGKPYPIKKGDVSYSIAENIISFSDIYTNDDFEELWTYIQVLQDNNLLVIKEEDIEGTPYSEIKIKI